MLYTLKVRVDPVKKSLKCQCLKIKAFDKDTVGPDLACNYDCGLPGKEKNSFCDIQLETNIGTSTLVTNHEVLKFGIF